YFLNQSTPGVVLLSAGNSVHADTDCTNGGVLADFDGDGDLDLAVANFLADVDPACQSSRNRLYLNQFVESGAVSFAVATDISEDEHQTHQLAAADLNGDGHIDIVVGNESGIPGVPGFDRRYLHNGTEDPDNAFPADFTLEVQAGANYTFVDNTITPALDFVGDLLVSVIVNDGTDDSEAFELTVKVGSPYFTSTPGEDATEDVAYTYDIVATDPDGAVALTITAQNLPA